MIWNQAVWPQNLCSYILYHSVSLYEFLRKINISDFQRLAVLYPTIFLFYLKTLFGNLEHHKENCSKKNTWHIKWLGLQECQEKWGMIRDTGGLSFISNTVSLVHSTLLWAYSAMMNQSMNSIAWYYIFCSSLKFQNSFPLSVRHPHLPWYSGNGKQTCQNLAQNCFFPWSPVLDNDVTICSLI